MFYIMSTKLIISMYPAHVGHIGTDRSLLKRHDALLLRKIARIFYMHYHIDVITHGTAFFEPVVSTGGIESITQ